MRNIFIGRPAYWLLWVIVIGVLSAAGSALLHTHNFSLFIGLLVALSTGCVVTIIITYRDGERITREPIDDD
jgi:pheromone shutdown protein TraB